MKSTLKEKNILVTGGTGSIGSQIVRELLKFNVAKIVIFSRDEIKQFIMKKTIDDDRLEFIIGDVRDRGKVEKIFNEHKLDIVYHTAALKHVLICKNNPIEVVKTNVIGTQNIVDSAKRYDVPKLINISTDKAVYPINVMGATKLITERIVLNANYTSVRFGNVACSRGSVIPVLLKELIEKKRITITDPNVTRFIMRIVDAVKLIMKATKHANGGEIFILKMKAFKLSDLVDVLIHRIAPKLKIGNEKIKVKMLGLLPGEKLHETLISRHEAGYLHDLGDMYMITPKMKPKKTSSNNIVLSSDKAELISKDELTKIIEEYLHSKERNA